MIDTFPWAALIGGMLLGLSAALLMLFSGKVAGISGIISGVIKPKKNDYGWRVTFLIGMVISAYIVNPFGFLLPVIDDFNLLLIVLAGLLVGFGTRLGNGCTSGHGIVGIGRLSKRSIFATLTFIISGVVVVFIRQMIGAI